MIFTIINYIASVNSLSYETQSNYNGKSTVEFTVIATMKKNNSKYDSSYFYVGFKIKNSKGIVVASEKTMMDAVKVGESVKDTFSVYNLDPNDSYTMTFTDPEH